MANNINISQISDTKKLVSIIESYIESMDDGESKQLMKEIDLDAVKARFERSGSKIFDEFNDVIKGFIENMQNINDKEAESFQTNWKKTLKDQSIEKCIDCYYYWAKYELTDPNDYFTWVCRKPHLLAYIHCENQWWPFKVLSVDEDEIIAERFGDHKRYKKYITFNKGILLADSEEHLRKKHTTLSEKRSDEMKDEFVRSFKEVADYIKNIKQKYSKCGKPAFVPARNKRQKITDSDQHLKDMFPAAFVQAQQRQVSMDHPYTPHILGVPRQVNGQHNASARASIHTPAKSLGYVSHDNDSDGHDSRPIRVKTEHFEQEDDPIIEMRAIDSDSMPAGGSNNRKRKNGSSNGLRNLPANRRDKTIRISGRIPHMNDDVTATDDETDTERPSTSAQNANRQTIKEKLEAEYGRATRELKKQMQKLEVLQAKCKAIDSKIDKLESTPDQNPTIQNMAEAELGRATRELKKQEKKIEELQAKYKAMETKLDELEE